MKLELVMLATVFSMITERQVEANLRCFENRDFTGKEATITRSTQDTTSLFPNGLGACEVLAKSTLILYSKPDYQGEISTFNGDDKRIYPRSRFNTSSILMIGSPTIKKGLFLFQKENFQGGVFQSFNGEVENVQGKITFGSVVVIGEFEDWTVARSCHKSDCERKCLVCFKRAKSRASFFRSINNTGMGETKTILPGACLGTNYDGESDIPECPCNPYGVVPGPDQCKGNKGICKCKRKAYFTGDDCDSCQYPHVYKDGKCIECKCPVHAVKDKDITCDPEGNCKCGDVYTGKRCDQCKNGHYKVGNVCKDCKCPFHAVKNNDTGCDPGGNCKCNSLHTGQKCNLCSNIAYKEGNVCKDCKCNVHGVKNGNLSCTSGNCTCGGGFYTGRKCDQCKDGSYNVGGVCQKCGCEIKGTIDGDPTCDSKGKCNCDPRHLGDKCDAGCAKGLILNKGRCQKKSMTCYECNDKGSNKCNVKNPKTKSGCKMCWGVQNVGANKIWQGGCIKSRPSVSCSHYGTMYYCQCNDDFCNGDLEKVVKNPSVYVFGG